MRFLLLVGVLVFAPSASFAQMSEFRIETAVFAGGDKSPIVETLTLISGDVVYDFMLAGAKEITVYDPLRNRIVLLDPSRKVQTTFLLPRLNNDIEQLKELGVAGENKALYDPQFKVQYNEQEKSVMLKGLQVEYWAKGEAGDKVAETARYLEFTDWAARLNAVSKGGMPPFSRLELNRELKKRQILPNEIDITIKHPRSQGAVIHLRSTHTPLWSLTAADKDRLKKAGASMTTFKHVSPIAYRTGETE